MFFKNAFVFAFTSKSAANDVAEQLGDELLQQNAFTPLGSTEMRHFGWTNSLGKGSNLTTESDGNVLICARSEVKILPAPAVKDELAKWVEAFEAANGRTASKKEREQMKEDVLFMMLPRAFNRVTDTYAYINTKENIIVINSASRGKAEDLLALLRSTIGTLPVASIRHESDINTVMTEWLTVDSDYTFVKRGWLLGREAEFAAPGDDSATAKVKNEDLSGAEVKAHLDSDQYVTKIELEYSDTMSFMLNDDLSIKRIKFSDVITEQDSDCDSDDAQGILKADFTLMAGELNRMISDLHAEFGDSAKNYLDSSQG
jgi:recombination associated protein RdgC